MSKIVLVFYIIMHNSILLSNSLIFIEPKKDNALSIEFLSYLKKCFNSEIFIETGTYLGETCQNASEIFDQIYTIELDKSLFERAKDLFRNNEKIKIFHGNSKDILNNIIPKNHKRLLFFLDAHWSEGFTARADENTPILNELECIKKSGVRDSIILIDDIRFFHSQDFVKKENIECFLGYPTVNDLYEKILDINSDYKMIIYGDMAIAYLKTEKVNISPLIEAMTVSRLGNFLISQEMQDVMHNAQEPEKSAVLSLMKYIQMCPNLTQHYQQWVNLVNK